MATKLILIRHGVTQWNKQKRYCGYKDVNLSNQGRVQVAKLRKSLKQVSFDKIYCSNRKRALQTKSILFGKIDFVKVKDLREIHFGVFEGLKHEQIMKKYSDVYQKWLKNPYQGCIPRAESMQVFKKRVLKAIRMIVRFNPGKTVAVVCHGGVIGVLVGSILKSKKFWEHVPSSASVTIVEYANLKLKLLEFDKQGME
ncbi:MAG: histidine phosphatase family protein [Candidatus Omnitrophota bacterium]